MRATQLKAGHNREAPPHAGGSGGRHAQDARAIQTTHPGEGHNALQQGGEGPPSPPMPAEAPILVTQSSSSGYSTPCFLAMLSMARKLNGKMFTLRLFIERKPKCELCDETRDSLSPW